MVNNNFKLSKLNLDEDVDLSGWINKIRKMGDLVFLDLRGINGLVQVVFDKNNNFYNEVTKLKNDDVISISGKVVERRNKNLNIFSGEIEIIANNLKKISSPVLQLPILPYENITTLEQIRMKYRYLDLRRPNILEIFKLRSEFNKYTRKFFDENKFIEIETPYLTKPTYGGASELKVNSKNHINKEYALIQSPQIYKQLLMYAGFEKYYQIVKCFRDEDSRADRQIEFTQLDLEVSFIDEEYIYKLIEFYFKYIFDNVFKKDLIIPFKRMSLKYALDNYGSDKPDLRFDNKIKDLTFIFSKNKTFKLSKEEVVKSVAFENDISMNQIKKLQEKYKDKNIKLNYLKSDKYKLANANLKIFDDDFIFKIGKEIELSTFSLIFISGEKNSVLNVLGEIRIEIAKDLKIIPEEKIEFAWIIDWPLFSLNDENKLQSNHNPFVALKNENDINLFEKKNKDLLLNIQSRSYDLVLNGYEIGGGSIRINNYEIQEKVFKILGLKNDEIKRDFGWLIEAQKFGTPIHGGIALGVDRILAILLRKDSIREVIAFPKTSHGTDELSGAPVLKK